MDDSTKDIHGMGSDALRRVCEVPATGTRKQYGEAMTLPRRFFTNLADRYDKIRPAPDTPEYELWTRMVAATVTTIEGEWQSFRRDRFLDAATGATARRVPVKT